MSRSVIRVPVGGRPRPAIRLRPAPALEPPFDDEIPPPHQPGGAYHPHAQQLTLDLHTPRPGTADRTPDASPAAATDPVTTSTESWRAARRFVGLYLEILNGYRPVGQIRSLSTPGSATAIVEQAAATRQRVTRRPSATAPRRRTAPTRPAAPTRPPVTSAATRHRAAHPDLVILRRLRVCQPRDGVAEAAIVLATGTRVWAMAIRLETHHDRWLCTTLQTCDPDD